ncbi:hypothetical protein ABTM50_19715, partial [Acinetobacter baumannii]
MVDKYPDYHLSADQYVAQRYWMSLVGAQTSVFLCLGNHDGEVGWPDRSREDVASWSRTHRQAVVPPPSSGSFYTGLPDRGLYYAWDW